MQLDAILSSPVVHTIIVVAAIPVITAGLSFLCGLAAKIPGLSPPVKAAIGRVFTSFEKEVTPANVTEAFAEIKTCHFDTEQIAEAVAARVIDALKEPPTEPTTPAIPAAPAIDIAVHVPQESTK
jgi:hypothetical protein